VKSGAKLHLFSETQAFFLKKICENDIFPLTLHTQTERNGLWIMVP
jgi:hypothetical protein